MDIPASRLRELRCSACEQRVGVDSLHNLCRCGRPYRARYDLTGLRADYVAPHLPGMWRYAALLPHLGNPILLGEGNTPVLPLPRLAAELELDTLLVKDESQNPTASFKSRGLSVAVTMAKALGATRLAIPTAGNAGGALAAYGARASLPVEVFMPLDTPLPFVLEAELHGAKVHRVDGLIDRCGKEVRAGAEAGRWFDVSTLKEPYRLEGKKTMGLEIAEFVDPLPDVILYPTGGGTGLIGIWKAFDELRSVGLLDQPLPRMVAVQVEGCAPIVRAFQEDAEEATPWVDASTLAYGLRVPVAVGDRMMLTTLRESKGTAIAVPERAMLDGMRDLASKEGIPAGPESGALLAAARRLRSNDWLQREDRVMMISTSSSHKYPDAVEAVLAS